MKVVINLPTDIPSECLASMQLFSDFLQGNGRTMAQSKLDPALAAANVLTYLKGTLTQSRSRGSAQ